MNKTRRNKRRKRRDSDRYIAELQATVATMGRGVELVRRALILGVASS